MRWTWQDSLYVIAVVGTIMLAVVQLIRFHGVQAAAGCGL